MQSILEALARWRPPDGSVRSATVEVDPSTLSPTALITVARSRTASVSFVLALTYAESLHLPMATVANRLTALALDAYRAAPEPEPAPVAGPAVEKRTGRPAA